MGNRAKRAYVRAHSKRKQLLGHEETRTNSAEEWEGQQP